MALQTLRLRAKADKRLRAGHLWIYSNEIDTRHSPIKQFQPGEQVVVENAGGKALGVAYVNPNNLIFGRLVSRTATQLLDRSLLVHRINIALSLRERCFAEPYYRLIYGDSDGLPGLVVDRFGTVLVVQIATIGMEQLIQPVIEALDQVLKPTAILLRNDGKMRSAEDLESYVRDAIGQAPELVELVENNTRFVAPVRTGQKTGWFYDHRMNRARLQHYCAGKRVLDVFSYIGGWGVQAANAGASDVTCVDASADAIDILHQNAGLNDCAERIETFQGDAFDALKQLKEDDRRYDIVIVDPPAFIQKRKDIRNGEQAYSRINQLAIRLLNRDGLLLSASCSMHLKRENLVDIIRASSRTLDRQAQIIETGGQGPDHPIHPAIPETEYLKSMLVRVTPIQ
jgi:23S rRNA (cytosine1962-C5)-methyltransferase